MTVRCAFRVDASRTMGAGHVMRCLALAEELGDCGVQSRFVSRHMPESLRSVIQDRGYEFMSLGDVSRSSQHGNSHAEWLGVSQAEDAAALVAAIGAPRVDWLIVDHYALGHEWETAARAAADHILAIDDLADRPHDCDLLLDQNLYEDLESRYDGKLPKDARALIGPHYALLRKEFAQVRAAISPRTGEVRRLLVFFGGMDEADWTTTALEGLIQAGVQDLDVDVVLGAEHGNRRHIESLCRSHGFTVHVQTSHMAELMAAADLAIGAGGSATWERCCVGLPSLVVAVAQNQRAVVHDAAAAGLLYAPQARQLSTETFAKHVVALMENPLLLRAMSTKCMNVVDGRGARRVVHAMGAGGVVVRLATPADTRCIFEWRNHPQIRAASHNSSIIDWETHSSWFNAILTDPARLLLIGEQAGNPVGVVRFDIADDTAAVSIYRIPERSRPGTGQELLASAEAWLGRERPAVRTLVAEVLGGNRPSHRLFTASGYMAATTRYTKRLHS
jgi:UDP-2,4-diacetamido-2,4,6-trideoxy-beta-L-altropyranose hydrolase